MFSHLEAAKLITKKKTQEEIYLTFLDKFFNIKLNLHGSELLKYKKFNDLIKKKVDKIISQTFNHPILIKIKLHSLILKYICRNKKKH